MKAGVRLWRWSADASATLGTGRVNRRTLEELLSTGVIQEDARNSCYRDGAPSDIVYKLTPPENEPQ